MKLIFVSNYFNHHQLPFCDALYELLEGDFCFLQTQPMEEERVKMAGRPRNVPMCATLRRIRVHISLGQRKRPALSRTATPPQMRKILRNYCLPRMW